MNDLYLTVRIIEYSFGNDTILCVHASTVLVATGKDSSAPDTSDGSSRMINVDLVPTEGAVSDFWPFRLGGTCSCVRLAFWDALECAAYAGVVVAAVGPADCRWFSSCRWLTGKEMTSLLSSCSPWPDLTSLVLLTWTSHYGI